MVGAFSAPVKLIQSALVSADIKINKLKIMNDIFFTFTDGDFKTCWRVEGDLLSTIYLQNRKSFEVKKAGGATARVKNVEIKEAMIQGRSDNKKGVKIHSKWTALGTVGHWGHVHARQNYYDAILSVEPIEGSWKITALDLIEEKRLDPYL